MNQYERLFIAQYKSFIELNNAKNYDAICASIIDITTEADLPKYYIHYEAQISCSLSALSKATTNTPQSLAANVTQLTSCYVHMLEMVTANKNLITAVNLLSNLDKNESAFSVLGTHCSKFLESIRRCLQRQLKKSNAKRTSQLIDGLTKCLCAFAKAEFANNEKTMVQTTKLLYVIKEAAVNLEIKTWKCLDVVYQTPPKMDHFEFELQSIWNKKLSLADENVIFSAAVILYANKSLITFDQKTVTYSLNSLSLLIEQLSIAKEPTTAMFCYACKLNFKEHAIISITNMAQSLFVSYCKTLCTIDDIWETCARLTVLQLNTIGTIQNCKSIGIYRDNINNKLTQICTTLAENKICAASGVKFLAYLIENCDIHEHVANYVLMRSVFATYDNLKVPPHLQLIHVGYILAAIVMMEPRHAGLLKYVMFRICDAQTQLADVPSVEEYFKKIKYRYMDRVPFPQVSISELLLCQLRYSLNSKGFPAELKAIISNAVRSKTKTEPMQFLRVVYSYETGQPTKEQYQNLLNAYAAGKENTAQLSKAVQIRWHSLAGSMENLSYRVTHNDTSEKNKAEPLNLKEERHIFREMNLAYEAKMLQKLIASIKAFKKFDSLLTKDNIETVRVEAEHAVGQLIQLATHLTLRQYRKEAMVAYTVLYSLSTKLNDEFGHFAALGYFAGNSRDYPDDVRSRNSLRKIIESNLKALVEVLKDRERLSFRKQSSLLVCLMNIGLYYMEQGNTDDGKEVLRYVEQMMSDFEAQFNIQYNNSVRMRLNTINLKLITKYDMHSPFPPIRLAEHILQSVKNMRYLTTLDAADLPIALNEAMAFIARYCLARYDFDEIEAVVQMLVKQSMRLGLVYSAAKLIALCALFDLYKEDSASCLMKLKNLDNIVTLFNKDNDEIAALGTDKSGNLLMPTSRSQQNSPVRKQFGRCISPIKVMSGGQEIPFEKYLIEHHAGCTCLHCSNALIKELLLEMAWLHARTFFVCSDFENSLLAFEYLHKYWIRHKDLQKVDGEIGCFVDRLSYTNCMMFWHYGQSLMRVGKTAEASEMLTTAVKWYRNCEYVDYAMEQDITKQLEDSTKLVGNNVMLIKPLKLRMDDESVTPSTPVVSPKPLTKLKETPVTHISTVTKASGIPVIKFNENTNPVINTKAENLIKTSPKKIAIPTKTTFKVVGAKAAKSASNLPANQTVDSKSKKSKAVDSKCDVEIPKLEPNRRLLKIISNVHDANRLAPDSAASATRSSRRLRKQ